MADRARFLSLLGVATDAGVSDAIPQPDADAISALDVCAFAWPDRAVAAAVYVFGDQDDAFAALDELNADADPALRTLVAVNGDLLLSLTAPATDEAANEFLDRLARAFAGEE